MDGDYIYTPLRSPGNIRVLNLESAENLTDPLVGALGEVRLGEVSYTALSYSWALEDDVWLYDPDRNSDDDGDVDNGDAFPEDPSPTEPMTLNNVNFMLGTNLRDALRRLREAAYLLVWVDAICINQQDQAEKSNQVAFMGSIYKRAERVVAWLGEGDERMNEAAYKGLQCLLADQAEAPVKELWDERWLRDPDCMPKWFLNHSWMPFQDFGFYAGCPPRQCSICSSWRGGDDDILDGLYVLKQKRYFRRLWVVQEVAVPHPDRIIFQWGHHTLRRNLLPCFVDQYTTQYDPFGRQKIWIDWTPLEPTLPPLGSSLTELVFYCTWKQCSDPRDHLYGLLGMANHTGIRPDYSRSTLAVYGGFARYLVLTKDFFLLTCVCSPGLYSADRGNLPTWMPDLPSLLEGPSVGFRRATYEACWRLVKPRLSADNLVLSCRLYYFGLLWLKRGDGYYHALWDKPKGDNKPLSPCNFPNINTAPVCDSRRIGFFCKRGSGGKLQSGDMLCSFDYIGSRSQVAYSSNESYDDDEFEGDYKLKRLVLRPTKTASQSLIVGTWRILPHKASYAEDGSRLFFVDGKKLPRPEQRVFDLV